MVAFGSKFRAESFPVICQRTRNHVIMSAVEEELEEGEITDSDSMGEEEQQVRIMYSLLCVLMITINNEPSAVLVLRYLDLLRTSSSSNSTEPIVLIFKVLLSCMRIVTSD